MFLPRAAARPAGDRRLARKRSYSSREESRDRLSAASQFYGLAAFDVAKEAGEVVAGVGEGSSP